MTLTCPTGCKCPMAHSLAELASWKQQQRWAISEQGSITSQATPEAVSPGAAVAAITRIVEARMVCRYTLHQFSQKVSCMSTCTSGACNRVLVHHYAPESRGVQQNKGKETRMSALAGVLMNDQASNSIRAEVLKVSGSLRFVYMH